MSLLARAAGVLLVALVTAACGTAASETGINAIQPVDGRSGLQLSGTIGGRQVATSDGAPRLIVGDCDPNDGADRDVCFISRAIDGTLLRILFENPAVLQPGAVLPVGTGDCRTPAACDEVTAVAVVDVGIGVGNRLRATGGTLRLTDVQPGLRYAGSVSLELPDGRLSGDFNVVPRPDEED